MTDAEGNTVTRIVDVERTGAVTTITTTRPGVAYAQVETIANGLPTTVVGHDGLTSATQYDPLGRPWKHTDTRGNTGRCQCVLAACCSGLVRASGRNCHGEARFRLERGT